MTTAPGFRSARLNMNRRHALHSGLIGERPECGAGSNALIAGASTSAIRQKYSSSLAFPQSLATLNQRIKVDQGWPSKNQGAIKVKIKVGSRQIKVDQGELR